MVSQVSLEGAGLQRCEERVEFSEVGALGGFLVFNGLNDLGEVVLEVERRSLNL